MVGAASGVTLWLCLWTYLHIASVIVSVHDLIVYCMEKYFSFFFVLSFLPNEQVHYQIIGMQGKKLLIGNFSLL